MRKVLQRILPNSFYHLGGKWIKTFWKIEGELHNLWSNHPFIIRFVFKKMLYEKTKYNQIVVMGDSHSFFFSGNPKINIRTVYNRENGKIVWAKGKDKRFCVLGVGAGLAYNLGRFGTKERIQEKVSFLETHVLNKNDVIICSFGEIDIRAHVFKHVNGENEYKDVVEKIVNNYVSFLKDLKTRGYCVIAYGPIASQKDDWTENPDFPRVGSEIERNCATEFFNQILHEKCCENDICFFTIFPYLIDEKYHTRGDYIFDQCHLGQTAKIFLELELKKLGLFKNMDKEKI